MLTKTILKAAKRMLNKDFDYSGAYLYFDFQKWCITFSDLFVICEIDMPEAVIERFKDKYSSIAIDYYTICALNELIWQSLWWFNIRDIVWNSWEANKIVFEYQEWSVFDSDIQTWRHSRSDSIFEFPLFTFKKNLPNYKQDQLFEWENKEVKKILLSDKIKLFQEISKILFWEWAVANVKEQTYTVEDEIMITDVKRSKCRLAVAKSMVNENN